MDKKKKAIAHKAGRIAVYAFLGLWALFVLFPFYFMLVSSFKSLGSYNAETTPGLFPTEFSLESYLSAFGDIPLASYFLNTLIFSVITTALMLVVSVLAAFAFAGSSGVSRTSCAIFSVISGCSFMYAIAASEPWASCSLPCASQLPRRSTIPRASAASRTDPSHDMPHA